MFKISAQEPCELQKCTFKVEDAMSVHAMYSTGLNTNVRGESERVRESVHTHF